MARIGIVYWSMYDATHRLARALAEGIEKDGGEAVLLRAPDPLLPDDVRASDGVREAIEAQADVAEVEPDLLPEYDGLLFGSPTRFGAPAAQLQNVFDQTGGLWAEGRLVGKPAGFFTGAATTHGGHESTILSMSTFAFHQGMVIVPVGYGVSDRVGETRTGGGPYGPTHLTPAGDDPELSDDEVAIAHDYGAHFHAVADKLTA